MSLGRIPILVKQVHNVLHVVVKVGPVEGHTKADAALGRIVHRVEQWVVAPTPRPIHLKVLE